MLFLAVYKKTTVTVETVTMRMSTAKPDRKSVKTKPDKTIFVKKIDAKDPKKDTTTKPTVSTGKVQSNTTKGDKNFKTIGQDLQKHEGRTRHEQAKGKTAVINLVLDKKSQTDRKNNLKDEPVFQNVTQRSVNETSKVLENLIKGTKGSSNVTTSRTKVTTRTAGDQGLESKTNVTFTEKDKKLSHGNVTTLQAEGNSDKHVNGTSIESKTLINHFNTSSRLSVIGSVEVHNITSTGFILSWKAPRDMFKYFTVTRREIRAGNEDSEKIQEGTAAANVTDVQRPSSNRTSTKVNSNKPEARTVKKFSQVLAGTARSYHFKGLQPQMRYSVSLLGSGVGLRSKIHRLTLSTGRFPIFPALVHCNKHQ